MTPLARIEALEARMSRTFTGAERAQAETALADASAVVRAHGLPWPDPAAAPDIAVQVTLAAAERRVRSPEGYRSEMQGSYQYALPASLPVGVGLTAGEIRLVRAAAGVTGVFSAPIQAYGGTL
ncbi:hypothetical protein I5Q34_19855 [Streptomyces sp. AV19]|uniref:hypothetical protein n=1 Tax=Streptomyces sp. AV19 TaxID=2793068 RepID=UPI0018FEB185|nr:hypothetical protein [Streptomyces sp. AV19]MBH1936504.1 hypothetical protein [Streptomyces sp. AV19]MDG4532561.1 hypothetical protein [Streptomyces sp. AV19]